MLIPPDHGDDYEVYLVQPRDARVTLVPSNATLLCVMRNSD